MAHHATLTGLPVKFIINLIKAIVLRTFSEI
jgi:hypothetical protein